MFGYTGVSQIAQENIHCVMLFNDVFIKARFIFFHSCAKNIKRIKALTGPKPWHCFRPGMLIFLAIIIPTGAWMSRAAAGKFGFLCFVCALDFSICVALLTSSIKFWQLKAFSAADA